jgi:hypothetical protein
MKIRFAGLPAYVLTSSLLAVAGSAQTSAQDISTAWHDGKFDVDVAGVLGRSAIVLAQPNAKRNEAMPLGNGSLGAAVWSENGLTAQLNRMDTLPYRLSPGWLVIPGLAALTGAKDYSGRLNLYDGEFKESGAGMTATAYVEPGTDTLIVDVTGAKPGEEQTAQLKLWEPRKAKSAASGAVAMLYSSWVDDIDPGASGRRFGALAALTAEGLDVSAAITDPLTVTVKFKPDAQGHFRVIAAAPHYDGTVDALGVARPALVASKVEAHANWWHEYWKRAATVKIASKDGSGEYIENVRNIYLYSAAAEKGVEYPGTQAGIADMLSSSRDKHSWDAAAFWHWNIRMQVAANMGAGVTDLNAPYFNLYRENLKNIEDWTRVHMDGNAGSCVPETMRFNGQGIEYESDWPSQFTQHLYARNCDATFTPFFNSRTLSTGAEVGLWIWQHYLATDDRKFLADNYPVMASAARFLLSYETLGKDGLLHMGPSNAHESQWDVTDPTTDIAGERALFPVVAQAAKLLGRDAELVEKVEAALKKIPELPRTAITSPKVTLGEPLHSDSGELLTILPPAADAAGQDVIGESYSPQSPNRNGENIGLEPIWPYDLIGDSSPAFDLAKRTYEHRVSQGGGGWSFDAIVAARLGMGNEVRVAMLKTVEKSLVCVNGYEGCSTKPSTTVTDEEFYVEPDGVIADAVQEALVQDYDGLIRIAPAVPPGWDMDGSVFVRGKTKVDVQVRDGVPATVVIESGTDQALKLRNPWPGQAVDLVEGQSGKQVVSAASGPEISFHALPGVNYRLQKQGQATPSFSAISGTPATTARKWGPAQIGLFPVAQ